MTHSRLSFIRLLLAAAIMHLSLCTCTYLIGRFGLYPDMFDSNGVGNFAPDSKANQMEISNLTETLKREGVARWYAATPPLHVKLYSLSFAAFAPLFGRNILSAEPLNLLYYLIILSLVFKLGQEAFDESVGMIASLIIAVWPSFLLHSFQMLRDPLFIALMLALILMMLQWLTRNVSWRRGLANAGLGGLICLTLWFARSSMWELVIVIVFVVAGFLVARQLSERQIIAGNMLGAALLLIIVIVLPELVSFYLVSPPVERSPAAAAAVAGAVQPPPIIQFESQREVTLTRLPQRVADARNEFKRQYAEPGSNIDIDVQFVTFTDMVGYIPRAVVIAFFAPFPNMWLTAGRQVGVAGRVLSGVEMLAMFINYIFVALGLLRGRWRLPAWLLLTIGATGMTALGMVVLNIGALYRMRYVFWVLLIIVGVGSASKILFGDAPKKVLRVRALSPFRKVDHSNLRPGSGRHERWCPAEPSVCEI